FALIAFHATHVLIGGFALVLTYIVAQRQAETIVPDLMVHQTVWFWYFVVAVWIVLYITLFWI
ncbi:MAG: hypothetical protein KC496_22195, partial [Anaerolineae bacterium]|nr:hypothetical protein [Anaerolineae bacterium]